VVLDQANQKSKFGKTPLPPFRKLHCPLLIFISCANISKFISKFNHRNMRTRARAAAEGAEGEESPLKKQVTEQFSNASEAFQDTRRRVDQSKRVQKRVETQVRVLRRMKKKLETANVELREDLEKQQADMEKLQGEMEALKVAQAGTGEQLAQVENYRQVVDEQLQQQVDELRLLNTEIENVSDGYIQLIESDDDRKNVYLEYFADLLTEAKVSNNEIQALANVLKEEEFEQVKEIVEQLETQLYENPGEFKATLKELVSQEPKIKKTKKK
jgi:chromosome segregation ATPase